MINILVVEDDVKLNKIVSIHLKNAGYQVISCLNALDAFDELIDNMIDLIVSDIMMPEMDGFEFASLVRKQNDTLPILFMSAKDDVGSKQKGFQIGIDDYMVKPVDLDELVLRVEALLRRARIETSKQLTIGTLTLNADEMEAYLDEEQIPLTVKEFNILFKLLSYPKRTFTRNQLKDEFWGVDSESTPRSVDVYITKIRDKFADNPYFDILTVHGLGYKAVLK